MRHARGFTLLELMIALAIAAIVGAIALPSYLTSVRKGRRADAADAATAVLHAQERWRANNPSYTSSLASLNVPSTSGGAYYTLALSGASQAAYTLTLTAAPGSSQANDTGCSTMTVAIGNPLGKGGPYYLPAQCWSR